MGAQFPEIRNIKVLNADLHDTEGHLENVELLLDLDYRGNFHLSIDADMVLGKKGFLSIKGIYLLIQADSIGQFSINLIFQSIIFRDWLDCISRESLTRIGRCAS